MSRNLDPQMSAALSASLIYPCLLVVLTFKSATVYVWSGVGPMVVDGQTYLGLGSLGEMGAVTEGVDVNASGTTLKLSGIDPVLLGESLNDIKLGAPAKIYFGLWSEGTLIGAPYLIFSGLVDKPTVTAGGETISILLALENRLVDLSRATSRRYTAADQHIEYPDDTGFNWVEILNDISLKWGTA